DGVVQSWRPLQVCPADREMRQRTNLVGRSTLIASSIQRLNILVIRSCILQTSIREGCIGNRNLIGFDPASAAQRTAINVITGCTGNTVPRQTYPAIPFIGNLQARWRAGWGKIGARSGDQ